MDTATSTLASVPLDTDIAKRLERATAKVERDLEDRARLILLAFIRGASLREIADVAAMTHVGVKKLIDRVQNDFEIRDADGNTIAVIKAKNSGRPDLTLEQVRRRGADTEYVP